VNGVRLSLHPAGHALGSAQVRIEHHGRVWVASGDYHLSGHDEANATCAPFEPVRCECFITESTFGLPIYRWPREAEVFAQINDWWVGNARQGIASVLLGYSFGKAQRLLAGVDAGIGPIAVHGAVAGLNDAYRAEGVALPPTQTLPSLSAAERQRALIVAPPSAQSSPWLHAIARHAAQARIGPRLCAV
jgi:putative mRNA 3-end processing factor